MITVYKDIPQAFISVKDFNMSKTWNFTQNNIGTGSDDILVFEGIYVHSSSNEITPKYRPKNEANSYVYDNMGYITNYNYTLANGDKYMPVSESLNPNGSVKRMIFHAVKNLFYSSSNSVYYDGNIYDINSLSSGSMFLFYIPQKYLAESIDPGSFSLIDISDNDNLPYGNTNPTGINIMDFSDESRKGKLYDINNTIWTGSIGNISYTTGHIIITDFEYVKYFSNSLISGSLTSSFDMEFTSFYKSYQHEYVCVAGADEYNNSFNPTLYDEIGNVKTNLLNDVNFTTYVTGIGLYDDFGKLVAVAKLAKPLKKQKSLDSVYVIKFDI